ncbi:MAG TPA: hypothetical protein VFV66_02305 [Nonomuraea sp.]|nr:hypothetical protein [Nonomuraea sp.]
MQRLQRHGQVWPHSRTVDLHHFARLVLATGGLTAHLPQQDPRDPLAPATAWLDDLAGIHQDGGYAFAQLLWLAENGPDQDNTTVVVIDLLPRHRQEQEVSR